MGLGRRAMMTAVWLVMAAGVPAVAPMALAQTTAERRFDIPAQDLAPALVIFGAQSGLQVTVDGALIRTARTAGVAGGYAPLDALARLLAGSGFTYSPAGTNTVLIVPAPKAGDTALQLGTLKVEGSADATTGGNDAARSEGTHDYAAHAATVAGKMPLTLREIPQSVSVVTRQQLDDQNLFTIEDAMRYVPGITVATNGNPYLGSQYYARGYALSSEYDGVPSTASLDTGNPQFDLAIYDRIEVLKGSAGLLQGSGEPGGVVNFARKHPLDTFQVSGGFAAGSWNDFHGDADITGPLNASGTIRGRAVVAGQDQDFFYQGSHARAGTAYGIVDADLTPDTLLSVSATLQQNNRQGISQGLPSYTDGQLLDVSRSFNADPDWTRGNQTTQEFFGELTHKFDSDWQVQGSLRYRDTNSVVRYAATQSGVDPATNTADYGTSIDRTNYSWLAADVNATGSFHLLGRTHQLLIGANYDKTESKDQYGGSSFSGVDIFGPLFADPHDVPTGDYRTATEQYGVYGQVRLSLLDPLTAVLGGRLTHYRASSGNGDYGSAVAMTESPGATDHKATPYAGLIYDLTPEVSLYASYADVFVPQTSTTASGGSLPPRSGEQYEVGAKAALMDGKLNISGALFDLQDNHRAYNYPVGSFFYIATGEVETKGAEVEVSGSPLPGWDLTAGYTYLDAQYAKDATQQGQAYNAAVTPHHNFKLWSSYRFTGGPLDRFNVGGGVLASSSLTGSDGVRAGGYAVFSGQVGYKLDDHWQASLTVNNITDRRYYQTVTWSGSNNYYGDPRNMLFSVRMTY
ncbi:MAG: TonB-dependent siderophore receptor [Azospirillaceae bacterium]|nr:TonB-dependent siderophore receptor [Azospirillaceae bacterium]